MIGAGARLLALADDRDGVRFADRRLGASDRQGFGDTQARAVAERQHRGVARQDPGLARFALTQRGRGHRLGVCRAQGSGQAPPRLGRAHGAERCGGFPGLAGDMTGERFEGGERALQRSGLDRLRPSSGEKGAQIGWSQVGEIGDGRRRAETRLEKGQKLPGVAAVSLDRAR